MKKIKLNSIRTRITLCFVIMFLLLLLILGYYYINFRRSVNRQSQLLFKQLSIEMGQQLDERLSTIEHVAKSTGYYSVIQRELFTNSAGEKIQYFKPARELITINKTSYPYIVDILFYVNSHNHLYTSNTYDDEFLSNLRSFGLDEDITLKDSFLSNIDSNTTSSPYFFYYFPINNITYDGTYISKSNDAICAILCDMTALYQVPEELNKESTLLALFYNDQLISANQDIEKEMADVMVSLHENATHFTLKKTNYYTYVSPANNNWRFVCAAPTSAISVGTSYAQNALYTITTIGCLLIIILLSVNTQNISSSVNNLLRDLNRLHNSSDSTRVEEPKMFEFSTLAKHINHMLDRMELSVKKEQLAREKLFEAHMLQQKAEMAAYRSQINPHFLFNTMECIRSMAQHYQAKPIEEIVSSMAKMFRYSLYAESILPLSREIDHVQQYMTVTNIRFPGQYQLKVSVTEDALKFMIPSMLLQPFVENSIKHGINSRSQKGQGIILIKAWTEASVILHIVITDNGCGMAEDKIADLNDQEYFSDDGIKPSKDSIGIHNIFKRIKLLNPNNCIHFDSKYGYYTKIHLQLYLI